MGYPAGITLRQVQAGPAFALSDGSPLGMAITLTPNRSMIWTAAGAPGIATTVELDVPAGGQNSEYLPVTDQDGWRDAAGNGISVANGAQTHLYRVKIRITDSDAHVVSELDEFEMAVPAGDGSPLDLDLHIPFTGQDGVTFQVPDQWSAAVASAQAAAAAAAASAAGAMNLSVVSVKSAAYTAGVNEIVPVDASSAAVTVTLPSAPADKTRVVVKKLDTSTNPVTVARGGTDVFNKTGGSTSVSLLLTFQAVTVQYSATSGVWVVLSDDLPLGQLDTRFDASGAAAGKLTAASNLSDVASASSARTNLGLGTAATQPSSAFLAATAQAVDSAKIAGVAVTGTPTAGQQLVASSGTAATWAAPTITGQYLGSAATFAGLPTSDASGAAASNGDWAFLTADVVGTGTATAPQYPRGAYVFNGSTYSLAVTIGADFVVGTSTGTVAAGDDSRITGAAQKSSNLSDLANAATARTNLGLGSAATQASSAFDAAGAATTAQGASLQKTSNLSDLASASTARTNLGLGSAATQASSAFDAAGVAASLMVGPTKPPIGWYALPPGYIGTGTGLPTSGTVYFTPFWVGPSGYTIDSVRVRTSTAQSGGTTTFTVGIYKDDGTGYPDGTQQLTTATVTLTSAAGNLTQGLASALALTPGLYWIAILYVQTSAPTTNAALVCLSQTTWGIGLPSGFNLGTATKAYILTGQSALPTAAVSQSSISSDSTANIPLVGLRRSA